jgi:PBP1b-binding outer membrane lipoprotein LpoB
MEITTMKYKQIGVNVSLALVVITISGCQTLSTKINNTAGRATTYVSPDTPGPVQGVGLESQDIASMTDRMMRDMLANPTLSGRAVPPRIIVDSEYFHNESSSRINKNLITDRLRINLNQYSQGRMVFVGRHFADMVAKERQLKRNGDVDGGTIRQTTAQAGADFRLGGRISSHDAIDPSSGYKSRYSQIVFEMIDLELGTIVWGGMYEIKKAAQEDIIYR